MSKEREENFGRRSTDSFGWKSPIGWIQVTGKTAVVCALLGVLIYIGYKHDERSAEQNQATVDALREVAFVLTLPEPDRKALQLSMPASMRERLLRQERDRRQRFDQ